MSAAKQNFQNCFSRDFSGIFNRIKLDAIFQALCSHGAGFLSPSTLKET